MYDSLKEKKNQGKKNLDEAKSKNNLELNNLNDSSSYQYRIKDENLHNEKLLTETKTIEKRKNLIQNYIYKNDIVVNININSNNIKNANNLLNLSNISNSGKIISKKNIFEKIEENPNENYVYEYQSIRRNLHKKYQDDPNKYNNIINYQDDNNQRESNYKHERKNNNLITQSYKEKNRSISNEKYKVVYKSQLTINEKDKIDEEKNEGRETAFYNKKHIRNKFLKDGDRNSINNTITFQIKEDLNQKNNNEKKPDKKFYRKFRMRELKEPAENNEEEDDFNNNSNNILNNMNNIQKYRSTRFKQNKFFKKLLLDRNKPIINNDIKNDNIKLSDISNTDNFMPISPLSDLSSSIISKDDFLNISKQCKIPSFDENNISYIRPIGQGSYGVIYLVEEKNSKKQYALKSILCNDLEQILKHKKEFELSYSLSHNNFIKIYNAHFKYLDMTTYMLYILMERGESDWNSEIEKRAKLNKFYTEKELINILKQLIDVLSYFQKNNIAHRDIKPQNILVFKNDVYKITDLGEAKGAKNNTQLATLKGSHYFMSPNLFFAFKYNGNNKKVSHNIFKSDVFSLGYCFLYAMNLNMKLIQSLREENNMKNVINIVKKFGIDKKYSNKFMNIIYNMIQIDENKRMDFVELYKEVNNF